MRLHIQQLGPEVSAEKPDVVVIHGTGSSSELWEKHMSLLAYEGYRCFMPNLRGHGQTHEPEEPTDLDVHIGDVLETLEHHEVRFPAIFVGHSLGAIISVLMAERRPELFEQILAISMPGRVFPILPSVFDFLFTLPYERLRGSAVHKSLPRRNQVMINTHRHSLRQIVSNFRSVDFISRAPQLSCPIHFSGGRMDVVAPAMYVEQMHRLTPNSTLRIFEWAGHCCMDDQPEQFKEWFLEKVQGTGVLIPTHK